MKRKDLIKLFEENRWWMKREGHDHTIYTNGEANEPISRQKEINDILAKENYHAARAKIILLRHKGECYL